MKWTLQKAEMEKLCLKWKIIGSTLQCHSSISLDDDEITYMQLKMFENKAQIAVLQACKTVLYYDLQ